MSYKRILVYVVCIWLIQIVTIVAWEYLKPQEPFYGPVTRYEFGISKNPVKVIQFETIPAPKSESRPLDEGDWIEQDGRWIHKTQY